MKNILIILLVFYSLVSYSQDIKLSVEARNVVTIGESFQLKYTLNAQGAKFYKPDLGNFRYLGMTRMQGSGGHVVIVNGKVVQSGGAEQSWIFQLQATKPGKYTIKPAVAEHNGKKYKSATVTIEVVDDGSYSNKENKEENIKPKTTQDIFVDVRFNKSEVYQGEQILLSAYLYSRYNIVGFEDAKFPSFEGFWTQDIKNPSNIQFERTVLNNKYYLYSLWQKTALFPQRAGELKIDKYEIDCLIGSWGFPEGREKARSSVKKIKVKPLPAGKPISFGGAVGVFSIKSSIDKTIVKLDEPVTFKVTIAGAGNFMLFDAPKLNQPAAFEAFDPKIKEKINKGTNGISGSKTYDYVLIARAPGEYILPPIEFSYFDTKTKSYKTIKSNEIKIEVTGERDSTQEYNLTTIKSDVENLGRDIQFIYQDDFVLTKANDHFFGSLGFYLAYIFALVIFFIIIVLKRHQIKENSDIVRVKNKKASKISRKRLKKAKKYLEQSYKDSFYEEILNALWGYLSDKLSIPLAELNRESAGSLLQSLNVEKAIIDDITQLLDECEFARYAPAVANTQMDTIYKKAAKIIDLIEQKLKKKA